MAGRTGRDRNGSTGIIGESPAMRRVYRQIRQVSRYEVLVLLSGESGTGKDLVAQAIHRMSARRDGPFYPVNMGAIPKELIASTLFGHEKGAFTGANQQKKGMFETAAGGTLFLDEIGTMDEMTQIGLLRVLETRRFQRVGGTEFLSTDVRLIAATNVDLRRLVKDGGFREDLWHRLNVVRVEMPPLRKRGKDILLLAREFVERYSREFEKPVRGIDEEARRLLQSYVWPGNVRELENVIMRAVLTSPGELITKDLLKSEVQTAPPAQEQVVLEVGMTLDEAERELITKTLDLVSGNKGEAARLLGISRKGIYNKIKKYGLTI
ncbi:MAG: sigma-54-dependent Fis family transcriptional regulator [Spirochaetales bacterium]|nr:sigma-54-dependent Fis family transcriptional regulator [Spirochaetales bacterium]